MPGMDTFGLYFLEILFAIPASFVLALTIVLATQAAAALALEDRPRASSAARPRTAILVPAHDEAGAIAATVASLKRQTVARDRIVVVADNCSDETADLAAKAGAEVVVRNDPSQNGKGFALEAGLDYLRTDPPGVVVFIDADCRLSDGGLDVLARDCAVAAAPIQCLDLMRTDPAGANQSRLAEFAWRVRNDLRPTGFARLGLPCQLFGTGMALPWAIAHPTDCATSHVAEDLAMGLCFA